MTVFPVINRLGFAIVASAVLIGSGGCALGPQKTDAQRQLDKETAERVESALDADHVLYAKHISVRADNGIVRLTGFVWDPPDLDEARRVAAGVDGVRTVINDLELQRNGIDDSTVTR
jgi:osmotically-inducible protein OsmY